MKLEIQLEVEPFKVPTVVKVKEGMEIDENIVDLLINNSNAKEVNISLNLLSVKALHELCDDFRDGVFKAAGKEQKITVWRGE